ncbi:hypothetical protein BDV12DRAFT_111110 [Aspergillus spectabilis]
MQTLPGHAMMSYVMSFSGAAAWARILLEIHAESSKCKKLPDWRRRRNRYKILFEHLACHFPTVVGRLRSLKVDRDWTLELNLSSVPWKQRRCRRHDVGWGTSE